VAALLLIFDVITHFLFYCTGLADPYVKGRLGPFKFQTQIQRKTLSPRWFEEFKIPITSWESSIELAMEVRDKDPMFDDLLGYVLFFLHMVLNFVFS
jgi:Ca2+-dependent lipid-binding protein